MKDKRNKIIEYIVLTILAIIFLLPLCWVVMASFDSKASIAAKAPSFTLDNYMSVLTSGSILRSFANGLVLALGESVLVVIIAGLAAYPLSRFQIKGKRKFMLSMLFMTSLPITTIMVPVYKMFTAINLYDNLFGVMLFMTASALPYSIWMMKNFMDSVPVSLEEAAWCDGASRFRGIIKVVSPLMLPGIMTIAIYTFSGCWGNFFVPFILLSSGEKYPASITLYQYFSQHTVSYGLLAAYSVMYAMPSVILYVITQKWMSKGFNMSGADKG